MRCHGPAASRSRMGAASNKQALRCTGPIQRAFQFRRAARVCALVRAAAHRAIRQWRPQRAKVNGAGQSAHAVMQRGRGRRRSHAAPCLLHDDNKHRVLDLIQWVWGAAKGWLSFLCPEQGQPPPPLNLAWAWERVRPPIQNRSRDPPVTSATPADARFSAPVWFGARLPRSHCNMLDSTDPLGD